MISRVPKRSERKAWKKIDIGNGIEKRTGRRYLEDSRGGEIEHNWAVRCTRPISAASRGRRAVSVSRCSLGQCQRRVVWGIVLTLRIFRLLFLSIVQLLVKFGVSSVAIRFILGDVGTLSLQGWVWGELSSRAAWRCHGYPWIPMNNWWKNYMDGHSVSIDICDWNPLTMEYPPRGFSCINQE